MDGEDTPAWARRIAVGLAVLRGFVGAQRRAVPPLDVAVRSSAMRRQGA